jgi:hypothetical protein
MACEVCADIVEHTNIPHVVKKCTGCGRELHVIQRGENNRGLIAHDGESIVIPSSWLHMSMNPLRTNMIMTRAGLEMIAAQFLLEGLLQQEGDYKSAAVALEGRMDAIVNAFPPLNGLDINNEDHIKEIAIIMERHQSTREMWSLRTGLFLAMAREAIQQGNAGRAAWATACAERCRSMLVFKESFEEVVWMGNSARRVIDVLRIWDANQANADEEFWQQTFNENSYVLSQVFAVPMVFLKDKAYVGGMTLNRSDSRFIDYLFSAESSREAILIEIKSPTTPLLGRPYRSNRPPSRELAGSIVQVLNYRFELARNLRSVTEGTNFDISAFTPRCAVIVGNGKTGLDNANARRSFELFRSSLKDVEVITYDELFRKVEILAELFQLKRTTMEAKKGGKSTND